ncbi:MAG: hypothetical protein J0I06_28605, partial [Planctomycetes bacterium]|nr:hypothetical protein [Planctomycetota bacterium]
MKHSDKIIVFKNLAAGADELLAALEPADLAVLDASVRRISGFHALASQLLATDRAPINAAGPSDLDRVVKALKERVDQQGEMLEVVTEEIASLAAAVTALSARTGPPASERLMVGNCEDVARPGSARPTEFESERRKWVAAGGDAPVPPEPKAEVRVELPPTIAERLVDLAAEVTREPEDPAPATEPVPVPDPPAAYRAAALADDNGPVSAGGQPLREAPHEVRAPAPAPEPSANGDRYGYRLAIAKLLADTPRQMKNIAEILSIPVELVNELLAHEWFERRPGPGRPVHQLTDAGRAALRDEGYALVPGDEPAPARAEVSPAASEPAPERPDL